MLFNQLDRQLMGFFPGWRSPYRDNSLSPGLEIRLEIPSLRG
jgi:hypothetical protein